LRRGDIVTAVFPGEYGKPRPAIVIETDVLPGTSSVLLCMITSEVREEIVQRRILIAPSPDNGLQVRSQIQVDKIFAIKRTRCGEIVGRLEESMTEQLNAALALMVGLLD